MCGFVISNKIRKDITGHLIEEYAVQESLIATQLAQILQLEISKRESELLLMAKLPEIRSGSAETCNQALKEIYENPKNKLGNLGRVDENGFFKCSVNEKLIGVKAEKLGSYITDIFNDPEHKSVMSRAIKPVGTDSYLIAIHVPVFDTDGKFIGTIGGAIYLNDLKKEYLNDVQIENGGHIAIFDDDGTVLNHYKPETVGINLASAAFQKLVSGTSPSAQIIKDIHEGKSGTRLYSFEGVEKIAAFEPAKVFPNRNWRILVTMPTSEANNNIIKVGADKVLTGIPVLLCILVTAVFAFFMWITRRLFYRTKK